MIEIKRAKELFKRLELAKYPDIDIYSYTPAKKIFYECIQVKDKQSQNDFSIEGYAEAMAIISQVIESEDCIALLKKELILKFSHTYNQQYVYRSIIQAFVDIFENSISI
jgi:hypothetical protein